MTLFDRTERGRYTGAMARTLVAFQIDPAQLTALDRAARQAHNTRSGIVRLALDQFLGRSARGDGGSGPSRSAVKHAANCRCAACA